MHKHSQNDSGARHPIGVVTSRTRIPPDVLRAWERRYGAVSPWRSPTGRRLYSDLDVERLRLMRQSVEAGRRISDVAALDLDALRALVSEDGEARLAPTGGVRMRGAAETRPRRFLEESMAAVAALDRQRLERLLAEASLAMSQPEFRESLIAPMLEIIGNRWRDGTLRIAHEHLAAAVVRSQLGALRTAARLPEGAPRLIATTLAGETHELGALLAADAAAEIGWNVQYLGPDLPAEEIAAAARQAGSRVVALSMVHPADEAVVRRELDRLHGLLTADAVIVAGGRAASRYAALLDAIGARRAGNLKEFQQILESIQS